MIKFETADGSTVQALRIGDGYDVWLRNASGATISTVVMTEADLNALLIQARGLLDL